MFFVLKLSVTAEYGDPMKECNNYCDFKHSSS